MKSLVLLDMDAYGRTCYLELDQRSVDAIDFVERLADEKADQGELEQIRAGANDAYQNSLSTIIHRVSYEVGHPIIQYYIAVSSITEPHWTGIEDPAATVTDPARPFSQDEVWLSTVSDLPHILREIFGNPFRALTIDPATITATVRTMARQMYETRDFSTMPFFADALQDAGCHESSILEHCRSARSMHLPGCWVLDWYLGSH